jgi:hypothetical protein
MEVGRVVDIYTLPGVVSVQWITDDVGILRYHGTEGGGFGSLHSFSLTLRRDGDDVSFFALDRKNEESYTREVAKALHDSMRAIGVKAIHYERRNKKEPHENTIRL